MIRLAKWMASAAFGIGMAIGLLVAAGLQPAAVANMLPSYDPPPCVDIGDQSQDNIDYVNLLCSVHQSLFADGTTPGAGFGFDKAIAQPGKYAGNSWDGRTVSFEATMVFQLDFKANLPELYAHGASGTSVVGKLNGPAGSVAVEGTAINYGTLTTDGVFVLQITSILSDTDLDNYALVARVQAGVRVLDVDTFQSYPLDKVDRLDAASTASTDPATVYGTNVNGVMADADRAACIKRAVDTYNAALIAAQGRFNSCMYDALGYTALCVAAAGTGGILTGGIGWVIAGAFCIANEVRLITRCQSDQAIALQQAATNFRIQMSACGVTVA